MKKIILELNKKTENGRIYNEEILKPFLNKSFMGELNHPESPVINLKEVSHKINNLRIEENNLVGDLEILDTPKGEVLKQIINDSVTFEPRGFGDLTDNFEVQNYELLAIDAIKKS